MLLHERLIKELLYTEGEDTAVKKNEEALHVLIGRVSRVCLFRKKKVHSNILIICYLLCKKEEIRI